MYGVKLPELEALWLVENKAKGHVPQNTIFVDVPVSYLAILRECARKGFIIVCILWLIRQGFRLVRFVGHLSWQLKERIWNGPCSS